MSLLAFCSASSLFPLLHSSNFTHHSCIHPTHRAKRVSVRKKPRPPPIASLNKDEDDKPTELSRRVFNLGVVASAIGTSWVGYRIVFGDDLKSRIKKAISGKFPDLFPRESTPDERRSAPDRAFVTNYYQLAGKISRSSSIPGLNLDKSENEIRLIAEPLFDIREDKVPEDLTNSRWFNFVLYARLHVLADALKTPTARVNYAKKLAAQTFPLEKTNADFFLDDIENLMKRLETLGWISGYKMVDFDALDWDEIGISKLSVYANDPFPLQTAQLLGEEDTPEISPVISAWLSIILEKHGVVATYEDYYLDDKYRPDPEDFMPSQIVTTFDLRKGE